MTERPNPLKVLAVCGMGMGTSLILSMTTETAVGRIGIPATVSYTDLSSARGQGADVIVGQEMHVAELKDEAPVLVAIDDFVDDQALEERMRAALEQQGWL